jgi:hypothetical protein
MGVLCKWLATFDCLLMLDEHQILNSGNFGISNVAHPHPQSVYLH